MIKKALPFDLKGIQLSAFPRADHGGHALLHLTQDVGGHGGPLRPAVGGALQHGVLDQVLFVAVVREDHGLPFGVAAEHHVGVQDAAELSEEGRRAVLELLRWDVDHQDQVAVRQLLGHVVGAVQAIPLALGVVAALVAVSVGVVVFAVLVVQRAAGKGRRWD